MAGGTDVSKFLKNLGLGPVFSSRRIYRVWWMIRLMKRPCRASPALGGMIIIDWRKYRLMLSRVSSRMLLVLFIAVLAGGQVVAAVGTAGAASCTEGAGDSGPVVYFFYSQTCHACTKAHPVVENLSREYPEVRFAFCDVTGNASVRDLFFKMGKACGEPYPSYPAVFTSDGLFLEGYTAISTGLPAYLEGGLTNVPGMSPTAAANVTAAPSGPSLPAPAGPSLLIIAGAALIDGINPCAFAVLVFLLVALLGAQSRKSVIATGFAYTAGVFLLYILSGFGILAAVRVLDIGAGFSIFAGVVAILAGMFMVLEGLTGRAVVPLAIPAAGNAILKRWSGRHTVPAAFGIGILTGFFELPCTGGVYLAVLGMLSSSPGIRTVGALLLYNVIFVLPLIVITLLVARGLAPERIGRWREQYRQSLRLIIGLCMVGLGVFILAWVYL
jgi:cytochrome c biogenesis protein CcdA/thiol-disulfide isomerase/thioredoxin